MIDYRKIANENERKRKKEERLKSLEKEKKEKERKKLRNKREREKRKELRKIREREKRKELKALEKEKKRLKKEKEHEKLLAEHRAKRLKALEKKKNKQEKEKLKKKLKKIEKNKLKKKKYNHDYYFLKKENRINERLSKGDIMAKHKVIIMKNNKNIKTLATTRWKFDAYKIYNEAIEKNENEVSYPIRIAEVMNKNEQKSLKYEIMIVQETDNKENTAKFRNDLGMFIENVIIDKPNWLILEKHEWLVEEKFSVYGFLPRRERKPYSFIKEEIIMKDTNKDNIKRIFIYTNKLIIQYNTDFDFIKCKTKEEAERLYNTLMNDIGEQKYILFTGKLNRLSSENFITMLQKKTGWDRAACKRVSLL